MAISTKFSSVRLPQGSQLDLIEISKPVEISAVEKFFSETYMNRAFFCTLNHSFISKTRRDIQESLTPFFVPKWTFDSIKVLSALGWAGFLTWDEFGRKWCIFHRKNSMSVYIFLGRTPLHLPPRRIANVSGMYFLEKSTLKKHILTLILWKFMLFMSWTVTNLCVDFIYDL